MRNKGRIEKGEEVHHEKWYMSGTKKKEPSLGGLEPPTFRLTAERANRLRHRDGSMNRLLFNEYESSIKIETIDVTKSSP